MSIREDLQDLFHGWDMAPQGNGVTVVHRNEETVKYKLMNSTSIRIVDVRGGFTVADMILNLCIEHSYLVTFTPVATKKLIFDRTLLDLDDDPNGIKEMRRSKELLVASWELFQSGFIKYYENIVK